jgi:hypothetical protein
MSIDEFDDPNFEQANTGSHPMTWQWWHEIAESSDRQKQMFKSGSYANYVVWKSATVDKQVVQQFHYRQNNNRIIEYSSSLYSHDYGDNVPTYTFSLIE